MNQKTEKKRKKKHKKDKKRKNEDKRSSVSSSEDMSEEPLISPLNRLGSNSFSNQNERSVVGVHQTASNSVPQTKSFEELLAKAKGDVAAEHSNVPAGSRLASGRAPASLTPLKRKINLNGQYDPNMAAAAVHAAPESAEQGERARIALSRG